MADNRSRIKRFLKLSEYGELQSRLPNSFSCHWLIRHNLYKGFFISRNFGYVRPWNGWDVSDRMIPCLVWPWSAAPPNHAVRSWSVPPGGASFQNTKKYLLAMRLPNWTDLSITRTELILWLQNIWLLCIDGYAYVTAVIWIISSSCWTFCLNFSQRLVFISE